MVTVDDLQAIKDCPEILNWFPRSNRLVATRILDGKTVKEIAEDLKVSTGRVYQIRQCLPYRIRRAKERVALQYQELVEKQREYRLLAQETVSG